MTGLLVPAVIPLFLVPKKVTMKIREFLPHGFVRGVVFYSFGLPNRLDFAERHSDMKDKLISHPRLDDFCTF